MSIFKKFSFKKKDQNTAPESAPDSIFTTEQAGDDKGPQVSGESFSPEQSGESLLVATDAIKDSGRAALDEPSSSPESQVVSAIEETRFSHSDNMPEPKKKSFLSSLFARKKSAGAAVTDAVVAEAIEPVITAESVSDEQVEIAREIGAKPMPLPVIGAMPVRRQYTAAIVLMGGSFVVAGGLAAAGFLNAGQDQRRAEITTRIEMLSQRMLAAAQYAVVGGIEGLDRVKDSREELAKQFSLLTNGDQSLEAMAIQENVTLTKLDGILKRMYPTVDRIIELSPGLQALGDTNRKLEASTRAMYLTSEQMISLMQTNGSPSIHLSALNHLKALSERMRRNGSNVLLSADVRIEALGELETDFRSVRTTLETLKSGDPQQGIPPVTGAQETYLLTTFINSAAEFGKAVDFISKNARDITSARRSQSELAIDSEGALLAAGGLSRELLKNAEEAYRLVYASLAFVVTGVLSLLLLSLINNRSTRIEAWETAYKNKTNEREIIKFMGAIMPLEMGDLTTNFTGDTVAMEGITGGIRSSVNEAVSSLRDAMRTVKSTTTEVSSTVESSVKSSDVLEKSNERQSTEITDVVSRVKSLTGAIDEVTRNTEIAVGVTASAKDASTTGATVVSQTNAKMAEIRGGMQEVLKSVKHLGETSHEIGQIVEAIESITDRTQVLAVNASLEAAKAGAAGQGFQVLASEVNRLAEQSNEALRTITALVQRIQGETASTIRVVEDSAGSVVEGARLSEEANKELAKISTLSDRLNQIMSDIRRQSIDQAGNAGSVQQSMDRLLDLSRTVQDSVQQMVQGVRQIDSSMSGLKSTVSIFTTDQTENSEQVGQ